MSRRRRNMGYPPKKSAMGGGLKVAQDALDTMADRMIYAMVKFSPTAKDVIKSMFEPDILRAASAAAGVIDPANWRMRYKIGGWGDHKPKGSDVHDHDLWVNYRDTSMMPIVDSMFSPQPAFNALLDTVAEIRSIYQRFCVARHVLNWLDEHATPGAIRYNWPTVLSLAPACVPLVEASLERHKTPEGLAEFLPLMRESATTVASALLLPAEYPKPPNVIHVAISGKFSHLGQTIDVPNRSFSICG